MKKPKTVEQPPPDNPVRHAPRPPEFCGHQYVILDDTKHKVFCRDCDEEIDPYKALDNLAHSWERYDSSKRRAKNDAKVAEEKLAAVKRELTRAKSRLRTARAAWGGSYETSMEGKFPMPPMGHEEADIDDE